MPSVNDHLPGWAMTWYRRSFGFIIFLELVHFSNSIIHVFYENWEPCFVPAFREWGIPVTHHIVDTAIYIGIASSVLYIFDNALHGSMWWNHGVNIVLFLSYSYLRIINYYAWNNHYYLNMIMLGIFLAIPGGEAHNTSSTPRPRWEYTVTQTFLGLVYTLAGVSKISSAWLNGDITNIMIFSYDIILPNFVLAIGGLLLDLLGGLVLLFDIATHQKTLPRWIAVGNYFGFFLFHLHNLLYMFESIRYFPLHMLFSNLLFIPRELELWREKRRHRLLDPQPPVKGDQTPTQLTSQAIQQPLRESIQTDKQHVAIQQSHRKSTHLSLRWVFCWTIVIGQGLFAIRRFFILADYPWEILRVNDATEFHSQLHHFGWRMKSKTISTRVHALGKWPIAASFGLWKTQDGSTTISNGPPSNIKYIHPHHIVYGNSIEDTECAIQPIVNRVRRTFQGIDPNEVKLNFFIWTEVNAKPFQLIINPELNLIGASHLPFFSPPDPRYIEEQIHVEDNWTDLIPDMTDLAQNSGFSSIPFVIRAIPNMWIPNPIIATEREGLEPTWLICVYGDALIKFGNDDPVKCELKNFIRLPDDGNFHLKFFQQTLFVLGFE